MSRMHKANLNHHLVCQHPRIVLSNVFGGLPNDLDDLRVSRPNITGFLGPAGF